MKLRFLLGVALMSSLVACSPSQMIQKRVEREMSTVIDQAGQAIGEMQNAPRPVTLRVATYNTSMYDESAGGLIRRLESDNADVRKIAAVIQQVRPDVLLLNEFDYDSAGTAVALFKTRYLAVGQHGQSPIDYPYSYIAPVNTGVPSGLDLDNNGTVGGTGRNSGNDAWGYGLHPGQYGMVVLSRYPISAAQVRTFQLLKWSSMPGAMQPIDPKTGKSWYKPDVWPQLRLSSKSHWDVPITVEGKTFHFLVSHPTPPVFDGPEKRNRNRNFDEIRLWREYIGNAADTSRWLCDDKGRYGGLDSNAAFVMAGDQNADPIDGDGVSGAINQVLMHPRAQQGNMPRSFGAPLRAAFYANPRKGDVSLHTGDFGPSSGTLRLDYVIPSRQFRIINQGVFWPAPSDSAAKYADASDHHMVWMDLAF